MKGSLRFYSELAVTSGSTVEEERMSAEVTPLLDDRSSGRLTLPIISKSAALIIAMKLFGNAFEYQVAYFNIEAYMMYHANGTECDRVPCTQQMNAYSSSVVLVAAATFVLSTLGGLISDRFVGCTRVLIAGCIIQFWASVMFPLLIRTSLMCQTRALYYAIAASLTLCIGLVDPLLVYALLQLTNGPRSRRFLVNCYFVAAAGTEFLGCLPATLRYFTQISGSAESFEYIGVFYSTSLVVCTFMVAGTSSAHEMLQTANFEFPRLQRLKRYYMMVAAFIPFVAVIVLCRNVFYWREVKYYTRSTDDNVGSAITIGAYLLSTAAFSAAGAVATAVGKFPRCLSVPVRIQCGLCLMLAVKVALFVASFFQHQLTGLGQSHPYAIQWAYFTASCIDGMANSLTGVAMYELIDCIAERSARAMYVGIFYTTWGLGLMLTGTVVLTLQKLPSEGARMIPENGTVATFYVRYAVAIVLLLVSIAYYLKVTLPLAQPALVDSNELDGQHDFEDNIQSS